MSSSVLNNERLVELLVQRATDGLNASERIELNRLLGENPVSYTHLTLPTNREV